MQLELSVYENRALIANLYSFDIKLQDEIRESTIEHGELCKGLTILFCPVDTGWMEDHVRTDYSPDFLTFETGWSYDDFVGHGNGAFYPFFQEFGTVNHKAQPSLTPAYAIVKPAYQQDVRNIIRRAVQRFNRSLA